jgi:3-deoxy-D-manno-octulosonic-acid transferase
VARALRECGGAREVLNGNELVTACVELLADEPQRERMGAAVLAWHAHNRGAVERTLAVIREFVGASRAVPVGP